MTTALAFALSAEALLLGCAAAAGILHWSRAVGAWRNSSPSPRPSARRLALNTRIVDASVAELSELVLEHALRDLDLGTRPLDPLARLPRQPAHPG